MLNRKLVKRVTKSSASFPAEKVVMLKTVGYCDLLLNPIKEKFGKTIPAALKKPQKLVQHIIEVMKVGDSQILADLKLGF